MARAHPPSQGGTSGRGYRPGGRTIPLGGSSNHCNLLQVRLLISPLARVSSPADTSDYGRDFTRRQPPIRGKRCNFRSFPQLRKLLLTRLFRSCCQRTQRLSKTLHRDDAEIPCMAACLRRVIPSRDEEDVGVGAPGADHLLFDAADRGDRAVELDLARRRDAEAAVDVAAQFVDHVEGEGEPGRRPADAAEVDVDADRELDVGELLDLDSDDRTARLLACSRSCRPRRPASRLRPGPVGARSLPACASRSAGAGPRACAPASRRPRRSPRSARACRPPAHPARRRRRAPLRASRRPCSRARAARRRRRPAPSGPSGACSGDAAPRSSSPAVRAPRWARDPLRRDARPRRAPRAGSPCGRSRPRSRSRPGLCPSRPGPSPSARAASRGRAAADSCSTGAATPRRRRWRRARARCR